MRLCSRYVDVDVITKLSYSFSPDIYLSAKQTCKSYCCLSISQLVVHYVSIKNIYP